MAEKLNLMTPEELHKELRGAVSLNTLRAWRSTGKGPDFVKAGHKVLYKREAVEEWLEQNAKESL